MNIDNSIRLNPSAALTFCDNGVHVKYTLPSKSSCHTLVIGEISDMERFTCSYRKHPTFMLAHAGRSVSQIPEETLFLLIQHKDGHYTAVYPTMDSVFRTSLKGDGSNLVLVAETGAEAVTGNTVDALFVCTGTDPYKLIEYGASCIADKLQTVRLRKEKDLPEFIDYLGWCTYNGLGYDVDEAGCLKGVESFAENGVTLGFFLLDDGYQTITDDSPNGKCRLSAFEARKSRFPDGLKPAIDRIKNEYHVPYFVIWHSAMGYWGGVDSASFPEYETEEATIHFSKGTNIYASYLTFDHSMLKSKDAFRFYNDYHRFLRRLGVDGIKVDNQYLIEGSTHVNNGRIQAMREFHSALEASARLHFNGNLINCMSCSNDMLYHMVNSNLLRSSDDFSPEDRKSYGSHIFANTVATVWMGEFSHTDWDMFWSKDSCGELHAIARVVSGSPVYLSDAIDGHDFDVIKKLSLSDGSILRPLDLCKPTIDSLMCNPLEEDVLLKLYNHNKYSSILAAFNLRFIDDSTDITIDGFVSPSDVYGLSGGIFAVFDHSAQTIHICQKEDAIAVCLPSLGAALYTIVPVENDWAVIGLTNKYNSNGAVKDMAVSGRTCRITEKGEGEFLIYSKNKPSKIMVNGNPVTGAYADDLIRISLTELHNTIEIML